MYYILFGYCVIAFLYAIYVWETDGKTRDSVAAAITATLICGILWPIDLGSIIAMKLTLPKHAKVLTDFILENATCREDIIEQLKAFLEKEEVTLSDDEFKKLVDFVYKHAEPTLRFNKLIEDQEKKEATPDTTDAPEESETDDSDSEDDDVDPFVDAPVAEEAEEDTEKLLEAPGNSIPGHVIDKESINIEKTSGGQDDVPSK